MRQQSFLRGYVSDNQVSFFITLCVLSVVLCIFIFGCKKQKEPTLKEETTVDMERSREDRLTAELDKGKGTLLIVVKGEYLYPMELQSESVLESYPIKIRLMDYQANSLSIVPLTCIMLPGEITNDGYIMEFFEDNKWISFHKFRWDGKFVLGKKTDSSSVWKKYSFQKIRFKEIKED